MNNQVMMHTMVNYLKQLMMHNELNNDVSSINKEPSVTIISIHVLEKFGSPKGRSQPAPTVIVIPSSSVTIIH